MAKSGAGGFLKRNLEAYIFRFLRFMFQCWTGKKSGDNDCKNSRTFTSPYYIYQQKVPSETIEHKTQSIE